MNLIVVESPHKAETIGNMLGNDYVIKASKGHVKDLPKSDLGIDIKKGFIPKYVTIRGKGKVLKSLSKLAKKSDFIFIASDPDREGEAIGWHVKNSLKVSNDKVKRITFNAITKSAVRKALKNPGEMDMDKVNAQQARRLLDRIIGYKISPPMQNLVAKGTSAGRVQSVALKLVKDLDDKIEKFVPVDYWSVAALFESNLKLKLNKINGKKVKKVTDKKELKRIKNICKAGQDFKVVKSKVSKKKKNPYPPLKTSTMQKLAAKKLGFNSSKTMKIAQRLYEGIKVDGEQQGLITYMRTDSTRVAPEAKEMAQEYIKEEYGPEYVGDYQTRKAGAQDAHEAIRPTNVLLVPNKIKSNLNSKQYKLYKLIWNTFLSSQFAPMRYEQLRLLLEHDRYIFKGLINKQTFDGFEKSLEKVRRKKKMFKSLPNIKKGSTLELNKLKIKKKKTKPPKRFKESSLVDKLEKKGIGRPSTYAAIISKLKSKKYIKVKNKKFYTTKLGKKVVVFLEEHFSNLMDVKFTARMEKALDQIQEGKIHWKDYLSEYYSDLKPKIGALNKKAGSTYSKNRKKYVGVKTDKSCKKCNEVMNLKKGKYGFYLGCSNYPDCKTTVNIPDEIKIPKDYLEKDKIKLKDKLEEFFASKEEKLKKKYGVCSKCGKPFRLINGKNGKFLGCTGYPDCKNTKSYNAS